MADTPMLLVALLRLVLEKFSRVFLQLKQALMVTFNEKQAPTFRKYVAEPDLIMSNFLQSLPFFGRIPLPFLL